MFGPNRRSYAIPASVSNWEDILGLEQHWRRWLVEADRPQNVGGQTLRFVPDNKKWIGVRLVIDDSPSSEIVRTERETLYHEFGPYAARESSGEGVPPPLEIVLGKVSIWNVSALADTRAGHCIVPIICTLDRIQGVMSNDDGLLKDVAQDNPLI
jgi:hypothetical protein